MPIQNLDTPDVVLIGAGIMGATVGTVLKELEPSLSVVMFETLDDCGQESSEAWNNAGTGHAANCELNYTPQRPDGTVDISKALEVNTEFDISRQLWAHLVRKGAIPDPRAFIHPIPHMSFVWAARTSRSCTSATGRCPPTIATMAWNTARIWLRSPNGRR
jgi:malate dehydrogenase (quinone)